MFKQLAVLVLAALALSVEAKYHHRRTLDNCDEVDLESLRETLNKCEVAQAVEDVAEPEEDSVEPVVESAVDPEYYDDEPEEVVEDKCVEAARRVLLSNKKAAQHLFRSHMKRRSLKRAAARRSYHH